MDEVSVQKLYKYYETINDFNRLRILICLTNGDYTKEEIATILNMKPIVVYTHLNYLVAKKIVSAYVIKEETEDADAECIYVLTNREIKKILISDAKHINKI